MLTRISGFVLVLTMVSVVVASLRADIVNVNPPHGDPAYQAWSIFSPDAEKTDAYKNDVIVVFHGFKSAVPNHTYKRMRERFRETHTVLGVNYDYVDVADTVERLDAFYARVLGSRRSSLSASHSADFGPITSATGSAPGRSYSSIHLWCRWRTLGNSPEPPSSIAGVRCRSR